MVPARCRWVCLLVHAEELFSLPSWGAVVSTGYISRPYLLWGRFPSMPRVFQPVNLTATCLTSQDVPQC